jgi:phage host-nuclease inhibitor protein Gam
MAPTTSTDELPAMAVQDQIDNLLDAIANLTNESKRIEAELADKKAELTDFYAAGEVDESFNHNDWSYTYTRGRTTWQHSDEAKRAIKQLQEADKAMGRAIQKTGAAFWTVKPPAI